MNIETGSFSWEPETVRRRDFLRFGGFALVAMSVAACDQGSDEPGEGETPGGSDMEAMEAPTLAELVQRGELPPLAERLPENPLVVEPADQLGVYGGEWRTTLLGVADSAWLGRTVGYEMLLRWAPDLSGIITNLAESYEASEDGTEYVFTLRRGVKWSDGEPFTVDDIVFWNEVRNNRELYPAEPSNPLRVEKLDADTVKFTFQNPNGFFLLEESLTQGRDTLQYPAHYLRQFHKDHNPDLEDLVEEEGATDWMELFFQKAHIWNNVEIPRLSAWVPTSPLSDGVRATFERNPYYWKVDPEGRQLPYIDRVFFDIVSDAEVMLLRATSGEIDMQDRHIATPANKPVLSRNREQGDYDFFDTITTQQNVAEIAFNLTHSDPVLREIFNNQSFRIGLSHAIDRQQIIDAAYQRQGEPWQMSPRPESRLHNERLATQYLAYDPDLANQHLDEAGYTERDSDGFRLGPDGNRIAFNLTWWAGWDTAWPDVAELVRGYWAEVGVEIRPQQQERSLWREREAANDYDSIITAGDAGDVIDGIRHPHGYVTFDPFFSPAPLWRAWYLSQGAEGEEPPPAVQQKMALYDQIKASPDLDQQIALMQEILAIEADLFTAMGVSLPPNGYGIVKNNFHNVLDPMPWSSWAWPPGPSNPEQYFIS